MCLTPHQFKSLKMTMMAMMAEREREMGEVFQASRSRMVVQNGQLDSTLTIHRYPSTLDDGHKPLNLGIVLVDREKSNQWLLLMTNLERPEVTLPKTTITDLKQQAKGGTIYHFA
jgi:hypothetical protein